MTQLQTKEEVINIHKAQLSTLSNPRAKYTDLIRFGARIKAWFKNYIFPVLFIDNNSHHSIILARKNINNDEHLLIGGLILGAIPTNYSLKKLKKFFPALKRVSLLTIDEEQSMNYAEIEHDIPTISIPMFDHGVILATSGKNIVLDVFKKQLDSIADDMKKGHDIYIHCMAGKGRSVVSVVSLLYLHPELWEMELQKYGLLSIPSIREVLDFVRKKRPTANKLEKLEGDQAGFLGLIALKHASDNIYKNGYLLKEDDLEHIAQDVALILEVPFDYGYRDAIDLIHQYNNFKSLYVAYDNMNYDLVIYMLLARNNLSYFKDYKDNPNKKQLLEELFSNLTPSEQAHFAILSKEAQKIKKEVQSNNNEINFLSSPLALAQLAIVNSKTHKKKLTIGDQVELLREFQEECGLRFEDIEKSILQEDGRSWYKKILKIGEKELRFNKYNASIQLAELYKIKPINSAITNDPPREIPPSITLTKEQEQLNINSKMETTNVAEYQ